MYWWWAFLYLGLLYELVLLTGFWRSVLCTKVYFCSVSCLIERFSLENQMAQIFLWTLDKSCGAKYHLQLCLLNGSLITVKLQAICFWKKFSLEVISHELVRSTDGMVLIYVVTGSWICSFLGPFELILVRQIGKTNKQTKPSGYFFFFYFLCISDIYYDLDNFLFCLVAL